MSGRPDRTIVAGLALVAAGAAALLLGGIGMARATLLSAQIPYVVSGGIGGIVLIAVGLHLLAGHALGHERDRLDRVEAAIRAERSEISRRDTEVGRPPPRCSVEEEVLQCMTP